MFAATLPAFALAQENPQPAKKTLFKNVKAQAAADKTAKKKKAAQASRAADKTAADKTAKAAIAKKKPAKAVIAKPAARRKRA